MGLRVFVLVLCTFVVPVVSIGGPSGWTRVPCPVPDPLHNGFFADDSHGWVVSYGTGVVLKTENGGREWSVAARLDSLYYESLFFVGPSHGWLCGDRGTLLKTADGGATWTPVSVDSGNEGSRAFYGVFFRDSMHAFLVGGDAAARRGLVFASDDGGLHWRSLSDSLPGAFFEPIEFVDDSRGFIGGGRFVLRTSDGGRSWEVLDIGEKAVIRGIDFLDAERGWVVGHDGVVFRTNDGGLSWKRVGPFTRNRLRSVCFVDESRGFIVGDANEEPGSLWKTADAGSTWTREEGETPDLHRLFTGTAAVWVVGKSGTMLRYETGEE